MFDSLLENIQKYHLQAKRHCSKAAQWFEKDNSWCGEGRGGLEFCNSKGALPRGERQASYINNTSNEKVLDPILDITQKMKMESERGAEKFVRCHSLDDDSPKVLLFTDDQVDDLWTFVAMAHPVTSPYSMWMWHSNLVLFCAHDDVQKHHSVHQAFRSSYVSTYDRPHDALLTKG